MRWLWIDSVVAFEPERRMVAVKNVSLAEEHLHDHFPPEGELPAQPIMPASLILEGMAQTAGILVGSVNAFREKVILAKVALFEMDEDVVAGQCLRYDAHIERLDPAGAAAEGTIERLDHRDGEWRSIGRASLMFSHIDQNRAGVEFPEHNFVFGPNFRVILESSGLSRFITAPQAPPSAKH